MNSTGAQGDGSRGTFVLDSPIPGVASQGFDLLQPEWETQFGGGFRLPVLSRATAGDIRFKGRFARVRDVAIADLHGTSAVRTEGAPGGDHDLVVMHVVRRGALTVGGSRNRGEQTVHAREFLFGRYGRQLPFETPPHTKVKIVFLPAVMLTPLLGGRIINGPADSAEMRLLVAHTNMIHAAVTDLTLAGVQAAHNTLIELAKAVALRRYDAAEPLLAPPLAQAAKDLANSHLADPELTPQMLARELNVSVRTLQRAFATTGESVTAYIRHRRLEEARLALTRPYGLSVMELAAHWHFADSSHFIRAFKKQYGRTPTEYSRSAGSAKS